MSPRSSPRLECLTETTLGPRGAVHTPPRTAVGEPKDAARKGVLSSLRPDPRPVTVTGIQPGLHIRTTGLPVADWLCSCGHHERARGRAAVTALAERVQVGVCPHRTTPKTEGRAA
ncbi:hypothetical protein ACFW9V_25050 [Streptomyces hygroscopicus]|uniref:hypothetical protein n=1 Tax=Streptomyces hygroscopicus TaxID=1912 RepID=UPI0036ACD77E